MKIDTLLNVYNNKIEKRLDERTTINCSDFQDELLKSIRYSLLNGGKRLRPYLTLEFTKICNGDPDTAIDFACAVEMIHCYSLIHDDLPCMDNDDMRRGNPSNHKAYGESMAMLAGDALQTLAFKTIANAEIEDKIKISAIKELALYSGIQGMAGGQAIDLRSENIKISEGNLYKMHMLKTAALIKCACKLGCIAAGADEKHIKLSEEFGEYFGLLFQITDDILDVTSDLQSLGKTIGKDMEQNKNTFVTKFGLDKAIELSEYHCEKAKKILYNFKRNTNNLQLLCDLIKNRKK